MATAPTDLYTLSLHDALPIFVIWYRRAQRVKRGAQKRTAFSVEHPVDQEDAVERLVDGQTATFVISQRLGECAIRDDCVRSEERRVGKGRRPRRATDRPQQDR